MKAPSFDQAVRALIITIALVTVATLAFVFRSEQASGALIGLLGLGASFLFRGRVQPTDKTGGGS